MTDRAAGRAALAAGSALLAVYLLTLAPSVTFWDAGEFIAAIESWGVPHPPGTPLYVTLGRAWRVMLGFVPPALAANALSAVCTAAACALLGATIGRRFADPKLAAAAVTLGSGLVASVWLVATEAEVYAPALLLASGMFAVGADDTIHREKRHRLIVYLFALAAPLHASALVAAPAAIVMAAGGAADIHRRRRDALLLTLALVAAGAIATGRWWLGIGAGGALLVLALARVRGAVEVVPLLALGASALFVMLLRARFDPSVNQGNPATWTALLDVVARKQYALSPLWPREAPPWLQLANFFQYADWQFALGIAPETTFSLPRLAVTLVYAALAIAGARAHARADARSFRAMAVLMLSASLGVVAYLNLKAGPSIGWGILAETAPHEARERDYFFVIAFWTWGAWAAIGALAFARTVGRRHVALAAAFVLLPVVTNWRAMNRRREPDASAALRIARALLEPLPARAVLVAWGDNDTYPVWFTQRALRMREDVTVVTAPLLGAGWYREELLRRDSIDAGAPAREREMIARVVAGARQRGRPVAFSPNAAVAARPGAPSDWKLCGVVWIESDASCGAGPAGIVADPAPGRPATTRFSDPVVRSMLRLLECERLTAPTPLSGAAHDSLAAICNVR